MFLGASTSKKTLATRFAFLFLLWLAVAGGSAKDLPVGVAAAGGALWVSLRLLRSGPARIDPAWLVTFVFHVLWGSLRAGFDVARRTLAPRIDVEPGFVPCLLTIPEGAARNAFCLMQSLQPGTLPTGAQGDAVFVHALDLKQPVADTFKADQELFTKAVSHG